MASAIAPHSRLLVTFGLSQPPVARGIVQTAPVDPAQSPAPSSDASAAAPRRLDLLLQLHRWLVAIAVLEALPVTILFVLPDFHTNLQFALKALVARAVRVAVLVESLGRAFVPGIKVTGKHPLSFADARRLLRREDPDRPSTGQRRCSAVRSSGTTCRRCLAGGRACCSLRGRPILRFTPSRWLRGPHAQPDPRAT